MRKEIVIENVGPIERLSIPLPESGVVVLRGRNGVGKSHALAAVDSLISGRGKPPCRDGAAKGAVEGFGAKLTIGRSTRRVGEAEVLTLEGRLDISQLVQPPIKDEEAADRTRIKALIQLSGRPADRQLFEKILPQGLPLGELVPPSDQTDDPVVMAGRLKRALEAEARRWEKAAEDAKAKVSVLQQEVRDGTNNDLLWQRILHQPDVVRAEEERAAAESFAGLRELEARQEMAARQAEQIAEAKKALAALEGQDADATERIDAEIAELDEKIRRLEQAVAVAKDRRTQLQCKRQEAVRRHERIAQLRQTISQRIAMVSDEEIDEAKRRYEIASRRLTETIEMIRRAKTAERLEVIRSELADAESKADTLRDAARAVDDVLSEMVGLVTKRLRVDSARLVCDTDRGVEPFGELSPGERWRIALEIAVEQLGRGGIVTVPQEAWEALDPVNRAEIAEIAMQVGVVLLTAEADEHAEIAAEVIP